MQLLTAAPRQDLTEDQVRAVLTADSLTVSAGCELLDSEDDVIADISGDLLGGSVKRECLADVHGACTLQLTRELAWGRDRVRPYMVLQTNLPGLAVSARFNLGVFVLTTPRRLLEDNPVWEVQGYDKMHLLQVQVGDSYSVPAGTGYLAAVRVAIAAAGGGDAVLLDSAAADKVLAAAMTWPLDAGTPTTWLRIVNDLLAAVGYRALWADQDGFFRSDPYRPPTERPLEWRFDVDDSRTTIIVEERTLTADTWGVPNWWRFLRRSTESTPSEGAGQYTVTNQTEGPTSVNALGRRVPKVVWLDAADQAALRSQGDAIVAADRRVTATIELRTGPFPLAGHFDIAAYADRLAPDLSRMQARSWDLSLDGADMRWTWEVVA
ncbi:hypothetical protein [Kineococcus radiotolerans]|uniref:Uncharacterized protein n=1 Tax=Kineococcus radiotolerans (strain ATCC BAA-149 / DSM 14245 / SRS30216) TaxID=266940 RepID=A6W8Q5_KINRD|nr:hypothetical protein [Kineococcus radiotolerans]ABS03194.1 hypothetical protein Krad_1708 [Kineococcus radiotolerans SRS30216 = ATCC BAA-149]